MRARVAHAYLPSHCSGRIIERYLSTGRSLAIDRTRTVLARHRRGHLVPMHMRLRDMPAGEGSHASGGAASGFTLMALLRPLGPRDCDGGLGAAGECAGGDDAAEGAGREETLLATDASVVTSATLGALACLGVSAEELAASGASIAAVFPGWGSAAAAGVFGPAGALLDMHPLRSAGPSGDTATPVSRPVRVWAQRVVVTGGPLTLQVVSWRPEPTPPAATGMLVPDARALSPSSSGACSSPSPSLDGDDLGAAPVSSRDELAGIRVLARVRGPTREPGVPEAVPPTAAGLPVGHRVNVQEAARSVGSLSPAAGGSKGSFAIGGPQRTHNVEADAAAAAGVSDPQARFTVASLRPSEARLGRSLETAERSGIVLSSLDVDAEAPTLPGMVSTPSAGIPVRAVRRPATPGVLPGVLKRVVDQPPQAVPGGLSPVPRGARRSIGDDKGSIDGSRYAGSLLRYGGGGGGERDSQTSKRSVGRRTLLRLRRALVEQATAARLPAPLRALWWAVAALIALNALLAGVQAGVLGSQLAGMAADISVARTQQDAIFAFMHLSRHIRMCQLDTNGHIERSADAALHSRGFLPPFVETFRASLQDMQVRGMIAGGASRGLSPLLQAAFRNARGPPPAPTMPPPLLWQAKVTAAGDPLGLTNVANVALASFVNAPLLEAGVDIFENSSAAQPVTGGSGGGGATSLVAPLGGNGSEVLLAQATQMPVLEAAWQLYGAASLVRAGAECAAAWHRDTRRGRRRSLACACRSRRASSLTRPTPSPPSAARASLPAGRSLPTRPSAASSTNTSLQPSVRPTMRSGPRARRSMRRRSPSSASLSSPCSSAASASRARACTPWSACSAACCIGSWTCRRSSATRWPSA